MLTVEGRIEQTALLERAKQATEVRVIITPEGAYLNRRAMRGVMDFMASFDDTLLIGAGLRWREVGDEIGVNAKQLRDVIDGGVLVDRPSLKGRLQIAEIHNLSDSLSVAYPLAGVRAAVPGKYVHPLARRLKAVKDELLTTVVDKTRAPEEQPDRLRKHLWAFNGGDPRMGFAAGVEDVLPVEVGVDNKRGIVLWIRQLAPGASGEVRTETASTARA